MEEKDIQELRILLKVLQNNYGQFDRRCECLEKAIEVVERDKPSGLYECFHCGAKAVSWDSDFDFSDFGYEGEGVVNCCHCNNCGANIEYQVRTDSKEEDKTEEYEEELLSINTTNEWVDG